MVSKFFLFSFCWLTLIACTANAQSKKVQQLSNSQLDEKINFSIENSTIQSKSLENKVLLASNANKEISLSSPVNLSSNKSRTHENYELNKQLYKSQGNSILPINSGNYMTLTPTPQVNALGNPLYELRLYVHGKLFDHYLTVTGRAHTQTKNRHRSGTEAPLPDGTYKVARSPVAGTIPEADDRFLPIRPLFKTGRTDLGIHYDPSFEKNNGEDGTSGCIALTNRQDLEEVLNFVRIHQPQYIDVKIQ